MNTTTSSLKIKNKNKLIIIYNRKIYNIIYNTYKLVFL